MRVSGKETVRNELDGVEKRGQSEYCVKRVGMEDAKRQVRRLIQPLFLMKLNLRWGAGP